MTDPHALIMEQLKQKRIDALRREFNAVDDGSFDAATQPDSRELVTVEVETNGHFELRVTEQNPREPVLVNMAPPAEKIRGHRI